MAGEKADLGLCFGCGFEFCESMEHCEGNGSMCLNECYHGIAESDSWGKWSEPTSWNYSEPSSWGNWSESDSWGNWSEPSSWNYSEPSSWGNWSDTHSWGNWSPTYGNWSSPSYGNWSQPS